MQKTSSHTRVGILNNPSSKIHEDNTAIARGILAAFLTQNNSNLKSFLSKLIKEETAKSLAAGTKIVKFLIPVSAKLDYFLFYFTYILLEGGDENNNVWSNAMKFITHIQFLLKQIWIFDDFHVVEELRISLKGGNVRELKNSEYEYQIIETKIV